MRRIEFAQGNRKLMDVDVPHVPALPVELARLNSPVHVGEGSVVLRHVRRPIHERDYW